MITFAKFSVSVFASTLATILPPVEANLIEAPTFPPQTSLPNNFNVCEVISLGT